MIRSSSDYSFLFLVAKAVELQKKVNLIHFISLDYTYQACYKMKEKMRDLRGKFLKIFQKDREKEALTLDRAVFDKLYQPSTNDNSLSESLKSKLLPSSNFESEATDEFISPISSDFHTSPENRGVFSHETNDYTMDQLCNIIEKEIDDIQSPSPQDAHSPHRFLSDSSLATITEIQNVKFDHNWGTLYNVNQYPSDPHQWSFYETRAASVDTKPPR